MSLLFRSGPDLSRRAVSADQLISAVKLLRANGSSQYITREALENAAVVACVGLRAGAHAQLPIKGYERDGLATIPASLQPELLRSPSDVVVPSVWKVQLSISRDIWGFGLGRVTAWDAAMYPTRCEWINPSVVKPKSVGATIEWRVEGEVIDSSLLIHVPSRWVLPGDPVGISPLEHTGLVDLAKRAQSFGADWFRNGAVPSAIVYSDDQVEQAEAERVISRILERWRARQPAMLGAGYKYEKVSVAADESQFLQTITSISAQIAVSFNMPPTKIGAAVSGQYVSYGNRDQDQQSYVVDSINPDLVVVEESLDRHLRKNIYCKITTAAFLKSDLKTRMEAYNLAAQIQEKTGAVIYTEDEMRALEERAPLTESERAKALATRPPARPAVTVTP